MTNEVKHKKEVLELLHKELLKDKKLELKYFIASFELRTGMARNSIMRQIKLWSDIGFIGKLEKVDSLALSYDNINYILINDKTYDDVKITQDDIIKKGNKKKTKEIIITKDGINIDTILKSKAEVQENGNKDTKD